MGHEQWLAMDAKTRNGRLPSRTGQPVHKTLSLGQFDMRMARRVDRHHAVGVEQALVAFHQNPQIGAVGKGQPGAPVG